ncbi:MAG: pirin family protein [Deltaproteobacteria bacterium]
MITMRKADERGHADHGWLNTYHTFSFANYYDPKHMGFRALRVINEDRVQPGMGFPTHPHRDMEIISYVLEGSLEHRDSMGNGSVIKPGDVQRMSAGSGITHSEYNHSQTDSLHFLQIWIEPAIRNVTPGYQQINYQEQEKHGVLRLIASQNGRNGSVTINQDADVYVAKLDTVTEINHTIPKGRHVWLQATRGKLSLNGVVMKQGDGAAISDEEQLQITSPEHAELLLFDLS